MLSITLPLSSILSDPNKKESIKHFLLQTGMKSIALPYLPGQATTLGYIFTFVQSMLWILSSIRKSFLKNIGLLKYSSNFFDNLICNFYEVSRLNYISNALCSTSKNIITPYPLEYYVQSKRNIHYWSIFNFETKN